MALPPNQCFEPTVHQRCWWVPAWLRAVAAAQAQRLGTTMKALAAILSFALLPAAFGATELVMYESVTMKA